MITKTLKSNYKITKTKKEEKKKTIGKYDGLNYIFSVKHKHKKQKQ